MTLGRLDCKPLSHKLAMMRAVGGRLQNSRQSPCKVIFVVSILAKFIRKPKLRY